MDKKPIVLINDFSGGWNTRWGLNTSNLLVNQAAVMTNADYSARFALTKRRGVTLVGDATSGSGFITSIWNFTNLSGTQTLIRLHTTKLQKLVSGVWTDFQTGLTAGAYYDDVTIGNRTFYGNAVDDFAYYDGTTVTTNGAYVKGNIYASAFFRLWIAGSTSNPNRLAYSQTNDPTQMTGGDAGTTDFPARITSVKSFFTRDGYESLQVYLANGDVYDIGFDSGGIYKRKIRTGVGSISHRATKQLQNYNFTVDIFSNVVGLGYDESRPDLRANRKSFFIQNYLKLHDLSKSAAAYTDDNYILSLRETGSTVNNVIIAYDENYDSWRKYEGIGATAFAIYEGRLHFASSSEPNVFRFDSDAYSDDGVEIDFTYQTRDLDVGDSLRYKECGYLLLAGFISRQADLRVQCIGDSASTLVADAHIMGTGAYVKTESSDTLGSSPWATTPFAAFGGTSSSIAISPFFVGVRLNGQRHRKMSVLLTNAQKDVDFVITDMKFISDMVAEEVFSSDERI